MLNVRPSWGLSEQRTSKNTIYPIIFCLMDPNTLPIHMYMYYACSPSCIVTPEYMLGYVIVGGVFRRTSNFLFLFGNTYSFEERFECSTHGS